MRGMAMNRGLLLALTLGIGVLTGCAVQTANGDPQATHAEAEASGEHGGAEAAAAAPSAAEPTAEGEKPAEGTTPAGIHPDTSTQKGIGNLDNTQPIPWVVWIGHRAH